MNLPELSQLQNDRSTYITFSKALVDFDTAVSKGEKCYFSKMVALKLPNFENPNFYIDLSDINIESENPNLLIPKTIQYYMENIIRQNIGINSEIIEEITEIAFWKLLNKLGLDSTKVKDSVTFINDIAISNFVSTENNNGWAEIVTQIPNKCKLLNKVWKTNNNISDSVQCLNTDICLFDTPSKEFLFNSDFKKTIDFDNITYDEVTETTFDFNVLLLFYTDSTGIQKLHGINFIYPFENKVTSWNLTTFTQKTNVAQTIGYQFKFNMKSCNNEATQLLVLELAEHTHWAVFSETLGKLNSFLTNKIKEETSDITI